MAGLTLVYDLVLYISISTVIFFIIKRSRSRRLRLPPGSLGLPFLGETLQLIAAYKTENPEPFIDVRVKRFGSIFTTHIFGEPTVFSADPETNRFILQNEGKLFECSYPGSISNLLGKHSLLLMKGSLHKRMHSLTMSFANSSIIRDHLLVDIDRLVRLHMDSWTDRVLLMEEAKKVISPIYFDYFLVSYTWTTSCLPACLPAWVDSLADRPTQFTYYKHLVMI